jgi:hypothetical protein
MKLGLAIAAAGLLAVSAFAAEAKKESCLKVGEGVPAFQVVDLSGPKKGQQLCYVWNYGGAPVVMAFVKDEPAKATGLVAAIQKLTETHKDKNLKAFVVFTAGPEWSKEVEKVAAEKSITIPMTILPQGTSAGDYQAFKVNPEARNTVILYSRKKVQGNFVDVSRDSWADVEKATSQLVGK